MEWWEVFPEPFWQSWIASGPVVCLTQSGTGNKMCSTAAGWHTELTNWNPHAYAATANHAKNTHTITANHTVLVHSDSVFSGQTHIQPCHTASPPPQPPLLLSLSSTLASPPPQPPLHLHWPDTDVRDIRRAKTTCSFCSRESESEDCVLSFLIHCYTVKEVINNS